MNVRSTGHESLDDARLGDRIFALAAELFPIARSITGAGVRETLGRLGRRIDIETTEVPSGTQVFDWRVPREWSLRDAYIEAPDGTRVLDIAESNLHVLNYSVPVDAVLSLSDLSRHVFTLPGQPDLVPYRTSYYTDAWGFCMTDSRFRALPEGDYHAVIDARHFDGSLTYGEWYKRGETDDEVLLSAHICHPSLANDNCSGLAVLTCLAEALAKRRTRYSYRVLFAPGTIGAICWLARNEARAGRIRHGLVVSGVGDAGGPTYKKSRRGDTGIDRVMAHVVTRAADTSAVVDFSPYGYDERQFCSPGFNLPVGLFQASRFGTFPEYHTSADNLDFIRPACLARSFRIIQQAIDVLEGDYAPVSLNPKCEPQLGRRGLYAALGGDADGPARSMAMLWVMNLADGTQSLLDIAERSGLRFDTIADAACRLEAAGLLAEREHRFDAVGPAAAAVDGGIGRSGAIS